MALFWKRPIFSNRARELEARTVKTAHSQKVKAPKRRIKRSENFQWFIFERTQILTT